MELEREIWANRSMHIEDVQDSGVFIAKSGGVAIMCPISGEMCAILVQHKDGRPAFTYRPASSVREVDPGYFFNDAYFIPHNRLENYVLPRRIGAIHLTELGFFLKCDGLEHGVISAPLFGFSTRHFKPGFCTDWSLVVDEGERLPRTLIRNRTAPHASYYRARPQASQPAAGATSAWTRPEGYTNEQP